jgi:hypothetical protein
MTKSVIDDSRSIIDDSRSIIDDSRSICDYSKSVIDDSRVNLQLVASLMIMIYDCHITIVQPTGRIYKPF